MLRRAPFFCGFWRSGRAAAGTGWTPGGPPRRTWMAGGSSLDEYGQRSGSPENSPPGEPALPARCDWESGNRVSRASATDRARRELITSFRRRHTILRPHWDTDRRTPVVTAWGCGPDHLLPAEAAPCRARWLLITSFDAIGARRRVPLARACLVRS